MKPSGSGTRRILGAHDAYEIILHDNGRISNNLFAASTNVTYSDTNLINGTWYHVAVTYDFTDTKELLIYINGALDGTTSYADDDPDAGSPLSISIGTRTGTSNFYAGDIDELTFWNRVLTPTEIYNLNTDGAGRSWYLQLCIDSNC